MPSSPEIASLSLGAKSPARKASVRAMLSALNLSLRGVAPRLPGLVLAVPEEPPVEYEVDVLREALDEPEALRKARAALEDDAPGMLEPVEEEVERVADPQVLLHDGRRHAHVGGRAVDEHPAVGAGQPHQPQHRAPAGIACAVAHIPRSSLSSLAKPNIHAVEFLVSS